MHTFLRGLEGNEKWVTFPTYLHSFFFGVLTLFEVTSLTKGIYEAERPVTIYWGRILFLKHDRVSLCKKITPDIYSKEIQIILISSHRYALSSQFNQSLNLQRR